LINSGHLFKVIHALDIMKKGSNQVGSKAREATRYLEQRFKYRSDFLRAQQSSEIQLRWSKAGYITVSKENESMVKAISQLMIFQDKPVLESTDADNSESEPPSTTVDVQIPKTFRSLLSCCLYYRDNVAPPSIDDTDTPFVLVTDNLEMSAAAKCLGIFVNSSSQWNNWVKARGKKQAVK
jgi:hypothetical protein